jgi:hypothetical protein
MREGGVKLLPPCATSYTARDSDESSGSGHAVRLAAEYGGGQVEVTGGRAGILRNAAGTTPIAGVGGWDAWSGAGGGVCSRGHEGRGRYGPSAGVRAFGRSKPLESSREPDRSESLSKSHRLKYRVTHRPTPRSPLSPFATPVPTHPYSPRSEIKERTRKAKDTKKAAVKAAPVKVTAAKKGGKR